jgi:SpoIID/LytB domain protein
VVAALTALLVPILPAGGSGTGPLPTAEASTGCYPAGGAGAPFAAQGDTSSSSVVLAGGGWGHGVGMSQYGAQGAALLGCSFLDILRTYYPGAQFGTDPRGSPATVRVGLTNASAQPESGATATLRTGSSRSGETVGPVEWQVVGCASDPCATRTQPAGVTWSVRVESGRLVIRHGTTEIYRAPSSGLQARALHEGKVVTVTVGGLTRELRWGFTRFQPSGSNNRLYAVQHITSGGGHSGMDRYLWGLAEVPTSWHLEAQKAQVVAARSYAAKRIPASSARASQCSCDLYATTADQHYTGWAHERDARPAWRQAVNETVGRLGTYEGAVIDAFYSSSQGGVSEASEHVWTATVPYLRAVDTSRWERASNNPRWRWTAGFTTSQLEARLGVPRFVSMEVVRRGPGGRPTSRGAPDGVRVTYRDSAGVTRHKHYSGEQIRWALGLNSSLFAIVKHPGGLTSPLVHPKLEPAGPAPEPEPPGPAPEPDPEPPGPDPEPELPAADIGPACPDDRTGGVLFEDVDPRGPHAPAIGCLHTLWEVVEGLGDGRRYGPDEDVSRAQMASFIVRSLQAAEVEFPDPYEIGPASAGEPRFADIAGTSHEPAVRTLAAAGLVEGRPDGTFGPGEPVSRAQMATFIVRAHEYATGAAMRAPSTPTAYFDDIGASGHGDAINKAREATIATGVRPRTYDPRGNVTRAQMASFVARMLAGLVEEGVATPPAA